ncbi:MAG: lipoyl(octanoyl) transferase LipB [Candidatus Saccharimonadaceae bacterium]
MYIENLFVALEIFSIFVSMNNITTEDLGIISYSEAWEYQQKLFNEAIAKKTVGEKVENKLLFCEHPHVITLGKSGHENNLLLSKENLIKKGVEYFQIDRGGDITYHGPGQLVVYPIFDLDSFKIGLKKYISLLEEIIIQLLDEQGIKSEQMEKGTGVWLDLDKSTARKICAIGVRSSRFVTMHGLALNINTDLAYFSLINPCGFIGKGVTSIQHELNGNFVDMKLIKDRVKELFIEIFN